MLSLPQKSCLSRGCLLACHHWLPAPQSPQHIPFTVPALASRCWHPHEGSPRRVQPQRIPLPTCVSTSLVATMQMFLVSSQGIVPLQISPGVTLAWRQGDNAVLKGKASTGHPQT